MLVECFYHLEDYRSLSRLTDALPEGSPLLLDVGAKLQSVGLCSEAVAAFLRAGDARRGVDCCVNLHQWDQAMALAQEHNYPQVRACRLLLRACCFFCCTHCTL